MAIYDLYKEISLYGNLPAEYIEKQLHKIPSVPVVNRKDFLRAAVKGRTILDFGASGPMAEILQKEAGEYHGTDIVANDKIKNFHLIDLDKADEIPDIPGLQLIVAGEVIEHLSNAGHFLDLLHSARVPVILTTPNAHSTGSSGFLKKGIENVNKEHVAWYSYHTLKVLVERHDFRIIRWYWYNGKPVTAEGLIFQIEAN